MSSFQEHSYFPDAYTLSRFQHINWSNTYSIFTFICSTHGSQNQQKWWRLLITTYSWNNIKFPRFSIKNSQDFQLYPIHFCFQYKNIRFRTIDTLFFKENIYLCKRVDNMMNEGARPRIRYTTNRVLNFTFHALFFIS